MATSIDGCSARVCVRVLLRAGDALHKYGAKGEQLWHNREVDFLDVEGGGGDDVEGFIDALSKGLLLPPCQEDELPVKAWFHGNDPDAAARRVKCTSVRPRTTS